MREKRFFSYYQKLRMKIATQLLKENKMSVSEVGYALGFSNLSHFIKVFEEHNGIKPKAFQKTHNFYFFTAIHSISMLAFFGNETTSIVVRAGK